MKFYVYRTNKDAPGTHGWLGCFKEHAVAQKAIETDIVIQKAIYDAECARLKKMGRNSSSVPPIYAGEYEIVPARSGISRTDLAVERAESKVHFWYPKAIKDLLGAPEPELYSARVTHCFDEEVDDEDDGDVEAATGECGIGDFFPPMSNIGKSLLNREIADLKKNGF